jgi:thiosulfate/3-mercaptopyruvate sulfurtransferase
MKPILIALLLAVAVALAATIPSEDLIQPKDLAARVSGSGTKPVIFSVGPNSLYRSKHITGSLFAGPGNRPDGLELLKTLVANIAKDREIVLYCGCCPWEYCPNLNPAIAMLKDLGYTKVKVMEIKQHFRTDWTERGYPVESSVAPAQ